RGRCLACGYSLPRQNESLASSRDVRKSAVSSWAWRGPRLCTGNVVSHCLPVPREGVIDHRERWNRPLIRCDLRLVLAESRFVHTGAPATRGRPTQMLEAPDVGIMSSRILGITCHL